MGPVTVTVMTVYLRFDYMEMQGVVAEVKDERVPPPIPGPGEHSKIKRVYSYQGCMGEVGASTV